MTPRRWHFPDPAPGFPLKIGVVDMGSNAIRLIVAEFIAPSTWTPLVSERLPVRLAGTASLAGDLPEEAIEAAVGVMERFRDIFVENDVAHYRAVATSAVRESANQRELVRRVQERTGLRLEVISGAEEARLVYWAARSRLPFGERSWIMADLGGGSLEIALIRQDSLRLIESFGIGTVRLLEEFRSRSDGRARIRTLLDEYIAGLRFGTLEDDFEVEAYVASGGNIDELARISKATPNEQGVSILPLDSLKKTIEVLDDMTLEERIEEMGLAENRADVIVPAGLVYARLAERFGMSSIHVPQVGLKEGVMIDLVESLTGGRGYSLRHASDVFAGAVALGRRFRFEEPHGIQVSRLAGRLFDELAELHDLSDDDREILVAAGVLHDVGQRIAYKRHHKHSYYLISESEIPGLDANEVELVANVARYHRRADPSPKHLPFEALDEEDRGRVTQLSAILRLADALDREHMQKVKAVSAAVRDSRVELTLEGDGDLELELWALAKKKPLFESTFGYQVTAAKKEDA